MTATIWIKHPGLDAVCEVPATSLPVWRQSGWDLLTPEELAAREQSVADERAADEARLADFAARGRSAELSVPANEDIGERTTTKKNKETG